MILSCFIFTVQFLCLNVILQTRVTIMCIKRLLTYSLIPRRAQTVTIRVLTGLSVEQLRRSRPTRYY